MSANRVLVVEDDNEMRQMLEDDLGGSGFAVSCASDATQALALLARTPVDAVVTDLMMPGMNGTELLARIRAHDPTIPVVIMTAFGSVESAVEAMRAGAYHYVTKPFRREVLVETLRAALEEREIRIAAAGGSEARRATIGLVAESPAMKRLVSLIAKAAAVNSPVLIRGESGTGKELLAHALHRSGPRHDESFVPVNCSAIPEALLESLLFGHRRGAFTDAREDRQGLFQVADGGTIFLDEIGDMPASLQAKLLRTLQNSQIQPLGAATPLQVDVRVIAATHRDLEAMCAAGTFRQDLYYRLNVIPLVIPPLRERPEDVTPLATELLAKHSARLGRPGLTLSREASELIRAHSWPGNVRELENAVERAVVFCEGDVIGPADLPDTVLAPAAVPSESEVRSLSEVEREQILRALKSVKGNKAAAARLLGLDRKTLYRKIELYDLKMP
jgi:DNA-binding NtrC family response regulator